VSRRKHIYTSLLSHNGMASIKYIFHKLTTTFGPALLAVNESFSIKRAWIFEKRQKLCLQLKIEARSDLGILGPSHKLTRCDTEQLQVSWNMVRWRSYFTKWRKRKVYCGGCITPFANSNFAFLNTRFETRTAVLAFSDIGTSEYFFVLGLYDC
jgi:hypothetical protein